MVYLLTSLPQYRYTHTSYLTILSCKNADLWWVFGDMPFFKSKNMWQWLWLSWKLALIAEKILSNIIKCFQTLNRIPEWNILHEILKAMIFDYINDWYLNIDTHCHYTNEHRFYLRTFNKVSHIKINNNLLWKLFNIDIFARK